MMNSAIVLISGGLDSAVLCGKLIADGLQVLGLFIDYGQKTVEAEYRSASFFADNLGISLTKISLPLDEKLTKGCLFDNTNTISQWESHFVSFLPQRNLFFLTIAAMFGQNLGIRKIYLGLIKLNGEPFPDTTETFISLAENVLQLSYPALSIHAPFINMTKKEVAEYGSQLGIKLEYTFSCDMANDHHCMRCPSCIDRENAMIDIK